MKKFVAMFLLVLLIAPAVFAGGGGEDQEIVLSWPTIWVGQDSKAATVEALVNEFNAMHEGEIRVEMEPNPNYDEYRNKINTQIAAGVVPDLFVFNPEPTTFAYYESDLLMDFTEDLAGAWGNDFVDGQIQAATRGGRTKSVPYEVAITPIWVNEALLAQAGVAEFPKTFEEFAVAAEQLKAAGIVPTSQMTGGSNAWTSMLWYSHIMASLGGPDVWENHVLGGDDDIYVEAARYLLALYSDGNTTKDAVGGDAGVSGGHYLAKDTAIFINGPWYIGRVRGDAPDVWENTGIYPAPAVPGGQFGAQVGFPLSNLAAANTDDPARRAAVIEFMKWMTKPENVKKVSLDAGSLFAIKYDVGPGDDVDPLQAKFVNANSEAAFVVSHFQGVYPSEVTAEFGQALGAMALGQATPEEFVEQLRAVAK